MPIFTVLFMEVEISVLISEYLTFILSHFYYSLYFLFPILLQFDFIWVANLEALLNRSEKGPLKHLSSVSINRPSFFILKVIPQNSPTDSSFTFQCFIASFLFQKMVQLLKWQTRKLILTMIFAIFSKKWTIKISCNFYI